MNIRRIIKGCIETERAVAVLYTDFARMFPEDEAFWSELAADELRHIETFRLGEAYETFDERGSDLPPLPEESQIAIDMDYLSRMEERIRTGPLTREEALKAALRIEEMKVEAFVNDLLEEARDRYPTLKLGEITDDERTHIEKITQYMISSGISHYA